jgi:hypothetical protein
MSNARVRLSQTTVDLLVNLGQQCGIEDHNTLISVLIRKYGDHLVHLLSPTDPNQDRLTQINPIPEQSDQKLTVSNQIQDSLTTSSPNSSNNSASPLNRIKSFSFD